MQQPNHNIEHLRGFAILFVLCHHFTWMQPALPFILWDAWSGVDLFFAISGYVIATSLSRGLAPQAMVGMSFIQRLSLNQAAIRSFFVKRLWRVFPPLLATLALAALLTLIFRLTTWRNLCVEMVAALSMTYNYVVYGGGPFLLDVLWSLAVEMQFYLLLPLFMIALSTNRQRLIGAAAVFLVIGGIVRPAHIVLFTNASQDWLAVRFSTHCRLDTLAAGVFVFGLMQNGSFNQRVRGLSPFMVRSLSFICLMLMLLIPAASSIEFSHDLGFSLLAVAAAGAVLLAVGGNIPIIPSSAAGSILRYVGDRSFSLYLVHRLSAAAFTASFPAVVSGSHIMGNLGLEMRFFQSLGVVVLTLIFAELMYRLIEKPSMEAGRRYAKKLALTSEVSQAERAAQLVPTHG